MYISPASHFDTDVERSVIAIETGTGKSDVETVDVVSLHIIMIITVQHAVTVDGRSENTGLIRFDEGRFDNQQCRRCIGRTIFEYIIFENGR